MINHTLPRTQQMLIPTTGSRKSLQSADSDRLLVLVLAFILWQNGASRELILALLYIAM